jgi:Tol biopolymer transport system component
MILGTLRYMSPEQARGKEVDERTDIFSLGVLLYEMIAGRPPFTGKTNADVIAAVLTKEPVGLATFVPETPNELQRIVTKMFRKERGERYQTMHDCMVDLKEVKNELRFAARLHSNEISPFRQPTAIVNAHTTGDLQRVGTGPDGRMSTVRMAATSGGARRKAIAAAIILGVLFLSAAGTGYYFGIWQRSPVVLSTQNVRQLTIWQGLDDFPSMSPDGNSVAFCSDHNGTFEIYVKALTPGAREIPLTNDGGQNFEPAWSHDGTRIAFYSKLHGGIWVVPSTGGHVKQLTEFGSYPAWSSDDKLIVFQSFPVNDLGAFARNALPPSTLWVVPATGGDPRQLTKAGDPPGGHGSPAFSPDGKRVAFETNTFNSSSIWTVSISGDQLEPITPQGPSGGYAPVYSADGRSIFYHSGQLFQVDIDPRSGKPLGEANRVTGFAQPPSVIRRISFSADGKRIAYSLVRRTESISSVMLQRNTGVQAASPVALVSNATGRNNYPAFSPDGKRIAFSVCAVGGTGCDIWLADVDGSDQSQLTTAESTELAPGWFPDGEQIAYISNRTGHDTYWAINLNTKRERMLLDVEDNLDYVRLSPDGKEVLFNRIREGVMNVWKAPLYGGEPEQLTFDGEMMAFPNWSPDGKFIAFQVKRGDDTNVMIMPSDGGTAEQLTFDNGQSWIFGWSPDGDKILFAGQRDGYWNAWWVSRSTKKKQQLTDYKKLNSFVRYPAWSPKGDQIAYEYSETTGNIWVADVK